MAKLKILTRNIDNETNGPLFCVQDQFFDALKKLDFEKALDKLAFERVCYLSLMHEYIPKSEGRLLESWSQLSLAKKTWKIHFSKLDEFFMSVALISNSDG